MVCPLAKMYTLGSGFIPAPHHSGGLRYHGMNTTLSALYDQGLMEAVSVKQTEVFAAAVEFARVEGILPAPESSHAIKVAIDEALKCKETGEEKTIVFGLTGTGYFDMLAYGKYNDGQRRAILYGARTLNSRHHGHFHIQYHCLRMLTVKQLQHRLTVFCLTDQLIIAVFFNDFAHYHAHGRIIICDGNSNGHHRRFHLRACSAMRS
jgi:hypothetical protein